MPLFLCNPHSSFYSNLIQLSRQQEAEGRHAHQHCWAAPFPTHPQPWRVPQTPTPMEQHPAFPVIYSKTFCALWLTSAPSDKISWLHLLSPAHHMLTEVLGLAAWWGFCAHPEPRGCSYICSTDSSLERFSTKLHQLCVRRGLYRDLLLPARSLCSFSLGC